MTTSPTDGAAPHRARPGRGVTRLVRRATIVGTGLIGGSVGMALRERGWHVSGTDARAGVAARAVELGALTAEGLDRTADLVVVATPVHAAGGVIGEILTSGQWNPRGHRD